MRTVLKIFALHFVVSLFAIGSAHAQMCSEPVPDFGFVQGVGTIRHQAVGNMFSAVARLRQLSGSLCRFKPASQTVAFAFEQEFFAIVNEIDRIALETNTALEQPEYFLPDADGLRLTGLTLSNGPADACFAYRRTRRALITLLQCSSSPSRSTIE